MLRRILTGLTVLAVSAALTGGAASAQSPSAPAPFTIDIGISEELLILPNVEQDNLAIELRQLRADPDVIMSWRRSGPSNVTFSVLDDGTVRCARFSLEGARLSGLKAGSSEVLMETVTIVAADIERLW